MIDFDTLEKIDAAIDVDGSHRTDNIRRLVSKARRLVCRGGEDFAALILEVGQAIAEDERSWRHFGHLGCDVAHLWEPVCIGRALLSALSGGGMIGVVSNLAAPEPDLELIPWPKVERPRIEQRPSKAVVLVACSKSKLRSAAAARALYTGALFARSVAFVEALEMDWGILSAKHGLVMPDQTLEPYEATLNRMSADDRRTWASNTAHDIARRFGLRKRDRVVMLAGRKYREFLSPSLAASGIEVEVPMEGLGLGEQKKWLRIQTERIAAESRGDAASEGRGERGRQPGLPLL